MGSAWAFSASVVIVLVWAAGGPFFHWSNGYQLLINSGTTIVTFWMVFIIQNSQDTDTRALHLKLDELLRAVEGARTGLGGLEEAPQHEVAGVQQDLAQAREREQEP